MIAWLASIGRWLLSLGPWLRGLLPAAAAMAGSALKSWSALKLGVRLAIIAAVVALFPLPQFLVDLPARLGTMPPAFAYFASITELRFGLQVIAAAVLFRWMWRIFRRGD